MDQLLEARKSYYGTLKRHRKEKADAVKVWNDHAEQEVETAVSVAEIAKAFQRAPSGQPSKEKALEKWIRLASTPEEVRISRRASCPRHFYGFWYKAGDKGYDRLIELYRPLVEKCSTPEELNELLKGEDYKSVTEEVFVFATERALGWCHTYREVEAMMEHLSFGKDLMRRKRDALFKEETGSAYKYPERWYP